MLPPPWSAKVGLTFEALQCVHAVLLRPAFCAPTLTLSGSRDLSVMPNLRREQLLHDWPAGAAVHRASKLELSAPCCPSS